MNKNNLLYLVLGLVILIALFYILKPKQSSQPIKQTQESTASAQPSNKFDLIIKNRKLTGPDTLTVTEGTEVTFNITSDEDEELHLHGYDRSIDLEASKSAQLQFSADKTGRFIFELEHSKTDLGALEVQPK